MPCFAQIRARAGQTSAALAALASLMILVSSAAAQPSGSFTLKISEKEMNLEHPSDPDWQHYNMWDLGFQRMTDRNMPYVELTNDSTSSAPITEFHLTIGDPRFHFSNEGIGDYAMLAKTTPDFEIASNTLNGAGDELVVHIGDGGLQPGDLLRFRIHMGVDAAYADQFFGQPDFRTILFDINGLNIYDGFLQQSSDADNAKALAIFTATGGTNFTVGPTAITDQVIAGPEAAFYNDHYRRYRDMDPVRTFLLLGGVGSVPEPASALLVVMGGVSLLSTSRWRRRLAVDG